MSKREKNGIALRAIAVLFSAFVAAAMLMVVASVRVHASLRVILVIVRLQALLLVAAPDVLERAD